MKERLYCNTCRRFASKDDYDWKAHDWVCHQKHEQVFIKTPDFLDKFDNDQLNALWSGEV